MENTFLSKFSLYDQVAFLTSGAIALALVYVDAALLFPERLPAFTLDTAILWILAAYFVGHVCQSLSNILTAENKDTYTDEEIATLEVVREHLSLGQISHRDVYNHCYLLVLSKDASGQIAALNAQYSLYRAWAVAFGLEVDFLAAYLIFTQAYEPWIFISTAICVLFTYLFLHRRARFFGYNRSKVLQSYTLIKSANL